MKVFQWGKVAFIFITFLLIYLGYRIFAICATQSPEWVFITLLMWILTTGIFAYGAIKIPCYDEELMGD